MIEGENVPDLQIIPRNAEQASNVIWLIDENNQLRRKVSDIIYRGKDESYLLEGLNNNDRIVTGSFSLMAEGLKVQPRAEEHTSELQSRPHLVCRLLLEKKKK